MLIRVTTDNGLIGYAPGPAHERAADEIRKVIAPFLMGQDPRRWASFKFVSERETTKTYRAVEIALIDLAARFEGCPLSEMIGGRKRERIKLYGSAGMYMSPEGFAAEAGGIAQMGFTRHKKRPAIRPQEDLHTLPRRPPAGGPEFRM